MDLKINLFIFFQLSLDSPLGGCKNPSSTKFFSFNLFTALFTKFLLTISVSEEKLSCDMPKSFKSFLLNPLISY